ncbi:MAG: DUF732 domain-containing protein [Candidatus Nanopelagicales bacterium]
MAINACAARILIAAGAVVASGVGTLGSAPVASADALGYLINITVRPGYNFPGPDAAVSYGYGVCDKIHQGMGYGPLLAGIMTDLSTNDEYQAVYLVNQAAEMLCPAEIWQLRQSAAGYVGPAKP